MMQPDVMTNVPTIAPTQKRVKVLTKEQKREKKRINALKAESAAEATAMANVSKHSLVVKWNHRCPASDYCQARNMREGYKIRSDGTRYIGPPQLRAPTRFEHHTDDSYAAIVNAELHRLLRSGISLIHEACHCAECANCRAGAYNDWLTFDMPYHVANNLSRLMRARGLTVPNPPARRTGRGAEQAARALAKAPTTYPAGPSAKGGERRLVGVEVEYNNGGQDSCPSWLDTWPGAGVHADGSCGYEAVTPPVAGEHVETCITELMKELTNKGAGCNNTCGIHVHVDARDMKWVDMLRFLTVYTRIEPAMFIIGGQQRATDRNQYARPCGPIYRKALQQTDVKGAILSAAVLSSSADYIPTAAEGRKVARDGIDKKAGGRYKSVNIIPWIAGRAYNRPDKTIEFRLHRGSHEADRVIHWAWLCADIVDWCVNATNEDVKSLPKSAMRCLTIMSPRNKKWILKRLMGWRKATLAGYGYSDAGTMMPERLITVKGGVYKLSA